MNTLLQTIAAITTATILTIAFTTIGLTLYLTHQIHTHNIKNIK